MYNEAGDRFAKLLTQDVPQGVRNRAWFYLGQIWYTRGYLDKAIDALRQVQGPLPAQQEAQKIHVLANALLRQGHLDDAIALLRDYKGPVDWVAFARFNLGIALVREQRLPEADASLTAVGTPCDFAAGIDSAARPRQPRAGLRVPAGQSTGQGACATRARPA